MLQFPESVIIQIIGYFDNYFTYNQKFDDHTINGMLGTSAERTGMNQSQHQNREWLTMM